MGGAMPASASPLPLGTNNEQREANSAQRPSLRTVPMHDLHFVSRFAQPLVDICGDHHRAMLTAGTPKADSQIALALANVVRQQIDEKFRDAVDELLRLRKRADVL